MHWGRLLKHSNIIDNSSNRITIIIASYHVESTLNFLLKLIDFLDFKFDITIVLVAADNIAANISHIKDTNHTVSNTTSYKLHNLPSLIHTLRAIHGLHNN